MTELADELKVARDQLQDRAVKNQDATPEPIPSEGLKLDDLNKFRADVYSALVEVFNTSTVSNHEGTLNTLIAELRASRVDAAKYLHQRDNLVTSAVTRTEQINAHLARIQELEGALQTATRREHEHARPKHQAGHWTTCEMAPCKEFGAILTSKEETTFLARDSYDGEDYPIDLPSEETVTQFATHGYVDAALRSALKFHRQDFHTPASPKEETPDA